MVKSFVKTGPAKRKGLYRADGRKRGLRLILHYHNSGLSYPLKRKDIRSITGHYVENGWLKNVCYVAGVLSLDARDIAETLSLMLERTCRLLAQLLRCSTYDSDAAESPLCSYKVVPHP